MEIIKIEEIGNKIKNNDNILIAGFGAHLIPNKILFAIKNSYLKTKVPSKLNLITGISAGDLTENDVGLNILALDNLVKSVITSHMGMSKKMACLISDNKIEAYTIPLGVYLSLLEATIVNKDKIFTKIGLNTFCDPRYDGCMANNMTKEKQEEFVKLVKIDNENYLSYKTFNIDVCILKASIVDKYGNISIDSSDIIDDRLDAVIATKSKGGIVIVEVNSLIDKIDNNDILIPSIFIDYIVISKKDNIKNTIEIENKNNETREKIAKRASFELVKNSIINIGVGLPETIFKYIQEEDNITITLESGFIGGNIKTGKQFGLSTNYQTRLRMSDMLKLYNSNFLDIAFLGAAQVDKYGNVNVSKFANRTVGPGGFIDIVSNARKIVFMTNLVNKKGEPKFIDKVEQITFSSKMAFDKEVIYITDVCVFKLIKGKLTLIEINKNINIKNILDKMEFKPNISNELIER